MQPGIFMCTPKEPCYFSDNVCFSKGPEWYASLFEAGGPGDLCGESSTHYSKLPTYPGTAERMYQALPDAKIIYVMRDPIDRIISHFIHEWTERTVDGSIDAVVRAVPRFIQYSQYAYQLHPYLELFGADRVLPVFYERLKVMPQEELQRITQFIGLRDRPMWHHDSTRHNVSAERLRKSPWRDALIDFPPAAWIRRNLVPKAFRDWVKSAWQMRNRPQLSESTRNWLASQLDSDLNSLGSLLDCSLNTDNFKQAVVAKQLDWCERRTAPVSDSLPCVEAAAR